MGKDKRWHRANPGRLNPLSLGLAVYCFSLVIYNNYWQFATIRTQW